MEDENLSVASYSKVIPIMSRMLGQFAGQLLQYGLLVCLVAVLYFYCKFDSNLSYKSLCYLTV